MEKSDHPGPWGSPLWDYLNEIRTLRMQHKTWKQIADELGNEKRANRVKTTPRSVRNFFVRTRNPKLKMPAGLEDRLRPQPSLSQPALEVNAKEEEGDVYDQALEAHLKTQQKKPPPKLKIEPGTKL